jgi:vitamin B12/bleomycin/antimicrobial peptide transport system ATP-binding/permease protein
LIRAVAGIWPFGAGRIEQPARDRILFLPRRPHLPIGSLRAAVRSPCAPDAFPDDQPWEQRLSTHEQQRLALARVLLQEPEGIVLDEATSDLDAATEAKVYEVLEQQVPNAAVLAIAEHLPRRWALREGDGGRIALEAT